MLAGPCSLWSCWGMDLFQAFLWASGCSLTDLTDGNRTPVFLQSPGVCGSVSKFPPLYNYTHSNKTLICHALQFEDLSSSTRDWDRCYHYLTMEETQGYRGLNEDHLSGRTEIWFHVCLTPSTRLCSHNHRIWDSPGGPVAKTLCSQCGGLVFHSWLGN